MHAKNLERLLICLPISDVILGFIALKLNLYAGNTMGSKIVTLFPGILLRGVLLVCLLLLLSMRSRAVVLFAAFFLCLTEARALIVSDYTTSDILVSLVHVFKLVAVVSIALFTLEQTFVRQLDSLRVLRYTISIYIAGILIGTASGDYYTTYGELGSSGWLIKGSANSLSIVFLLCGYYTLLYILSNKGRLRALVFTTCYLFSATLLVTKGAVVSSLISLFLFFRRFVRSLFLKIFLLSGLIFSALVFIAPRLTELNFMKRLNTVYDYYEGNILLLLLSGRNDHIDAVFNIVREFSIADFLLGFGHQRLRLAMESYTGKVIGVEVDILDLLFMNGMFFTAFYLTLIVSLFAMGFRQKHERLAFTTIFLCALLLSTFAGHVFFSGMAGHLLPLFVAAHIQESKKDEASYS